MHNSGGSLTLKYFSSSRGVYYCAPELAMYHIYFFNCNGTFSTFALLKFNRFQHFSTLHLEWLCENAPLKSHGLSETGMSDTASYLTTQAHKLP